jgi:hypothetical protein
VDGRNAHRGHGYYSNQLCRLLYQLVGTWGAAKKGIVLFAGSSFHEKFPQKYQKNQREMLRQVLVFLPKIFTM